MDKYTEQTSQSPIENKREQVSKKVWNIENTKLKEVHSDSNGRIDYRLMKNISNGTNFILVDNKNNKRFIYGKQNNRIYNLTTGMEET